MIEPDSDALLGNIDEGLLERVAALPPGTQRWLKTAVQAIRNMETLKLEQPRRQTKGYLAAPRSRKGAPNLEDVITGKVDLRKHLQEYPELAEELDGLADVIDMLRDVGSRRRKMGERILREEILGQPPEESEDGTEDEEA